MIIRNLLPVENWKGIKSNGFEFTDVEIDMIMMRFDIDGEDRITFADLWNSLINVYGNLAKLINCIRKYDKKSKKQQRKRAVQRMWVNIHAMDTDGNGSLDRNEFNES